MHERAWIPTFTGRKFHFLNCDPSDVDIVDIAVALSRAARFNGHTRHFYSVAQHSVLVSLQCEQFPLHALLHDAAEAYIGDITTPLKMLLGPHVKSLEARMHGVICQRFGIGSAMPTEVKVADARMLITERDQLLFRPHAPWCEDLEPYRFSIHPMMTPEEACGWFLDRYQTLTGEQLERRTLPATNGGTDGSNALQS